MKKLFLIVGFILTMSLSAIAEDQDKALKKANFSAGWFRDMYLLNKKEQPKKLEKVVGNYNKIIAQGGATAAVAKLHLAEVYSWRYPEFARNPEESFRLYKEASEEVTEDSYLGIALYNVGACFHLGYGIEQDDALAAEYYQRAYDVDAVHATGIATMYEFGCGVEQDLPKAVDMFLALTMLGENAYPSLYACMYILDQIEAGTLDTEAYENYGAGIRLYTLNFDEAFRCMQKAADAGFAPAQHEMGINYMRGKIYPITLKGLDPQAQELGEKYFLAAAEQGYIPSIHGYGAIVEMKDAVRKLGIVVARNPENEKLALEYYQKAADLGYPDAQVAVGVYYEYGYGDMPQDYDKANEYYVCAAQQGYKRGADKVKALKEKIQKEQWEAVQNAINNFTQGMTSCLTSVTKIISKQQQSKSNTSYSQTGTAFSQENSNASPADRKSKSPDNSWQKLSSRNSDMRVYNNWAEKLIAMKTRTFPYENYTMKDVEQAQSAMRGIRERWEKDGMWIGGKCKWETWDGVSN